jgi:hypothetical protein
MKRPSPFQPGTAEPAAPLALAEFFARPDSAAYPHLRAAFDYWQRKTPAGKLPGRQHIDPVEMAAFLPHVALIEVERDSGRPRFRLRVIGTEIVNDVGRDDTGKYLNDIPEAATMVARLTELLQTREPYYMPEALFLPKRDHIVLHRVVLPLASDGTTVDMILCAIAGTFAPALKPVRV